MVSLLPKNFEERFCHKNWNHFFCFSLPPFSKLLSDSSFIQYRLKCWTNLIAHSSQPWESSIRDSIQYWVLNNFCQTKSNLTKEILNLSKESSCHLIKNKLIWTHLILIFPIHNISFLISQRLCHFIIIQMFIYLRLYLIPLNMSSCLHQIHWALSKEVMNVLLASVWIV